MPLKTAAKAGSVKKTYIKRYTVHYYEVDFRGKALPLSLINYLQDAAGDHAARLGFSVLDLMKRNLTWLLSRYHVRVQRYPEVGETVAVTTWPSGTQGIFALRDFRAVDGKNETLAVATSSWVLWNITAKKPASLEENLPDRIALHRRALEDDFASLPPCVEPADATSFRVGIQDIDFNNHVNHASYILWALESPPEAVLRSRAPFEIEVAYRAEAFYGDEILAKIRTGEKGPDTVFLHGLYQKSRGTELARLRTLWRPV
jgi:medium-chain acyl-[acyl-carrier-protein] hydrolase